MRERVTQAIFRAIDEINLQLPAAQRVVKDNETALRGRSSTLDSLRLVDLIVTVEEFVEQDFGVTVNLADQRAMAQEQSPFDSVATLAAYVCLLLREKTGAPGPA